MRSAAVVMAAGLFAGWGGAPAGAETGRARINGTDETALITGTAMFTESPSGLEVEVQITGLPAGQHGLHIHQYGDCGNKGNAAGGHFNPDQAPHGYFPKDGAARAHPGDMGNIEVLDERRPARLSVLLPGVTLSGTTYGVGGRAVIVHEHPDDFSQPAGNAGGRIACGVILITGQ
jgi:Cu-Zn family superoxide dismutase